MEKESEIMQVLRMKEGTGAHSYSTTALMAREILSISKSLREKLIREFYCKEHPTTLCIADLGCASSEQNNLSGVADGLIETIDEARRELGHGPQEYHICLNDLPGNDFNSLFRSVTSFENKLKKKLGDDYGHCFVNGVPGSFYGRLFPANSVHFVHSSTSLHWLSQVPKGIEENKRNIYMAKTSPTKVITSYYEQFTKDFSMFLRCRSKEVVAGGSMVLTLLGRENNDPCYSTEYLWEHLAKVLNDMVSEGYIEEEKLNTFNIPIYTPSPTELEYLVAKEGSFATNEVHTFNIINWDSSNDNDHNINSIDETIRKDTINLKISCTRAVAEALVSNHFGEAVVEEVFRRYTKIVFAALAKEKTVITNVTISLTRS